MGTFDIMTLSITLIIIKTISITTLGVIIQSPTLSINETKHNSIPHMGTQHNNKSPTLSTNDTKHFDTQL